jgi:hypothetical protein
MEVNLVRSFTTGEALLQLTLTSAFILVSEGVQNLDLPVELALIRHHHLLLPSHLLAVYRNSFLEVLN